MTDGSGRTAIVLATFVALTAGFAAGYGLAVRDRPAEASVAPHLVGAAEYARLGMAALSAGDLEAAESNFRIALRLRPGDPAAHANLAVALMSQGRWAAADSALAAARAGAPDAPEVYFLEGLLARDGFADTTRAREAWERFLVLVPAEHPQAGRIRGWLRELDEPGGLASPP